MTKTLPAALAAAYSLLTLAAAAIAAAFLILITLGIGAEAIIRSLGIGLIRGIVDFAEHGMFNMAILAAPWILKENGHISVDFLTGSVGPLARKALGILADLCGVLLCITVAIYGTRSFLLSFSRGELIFQELIIPEWWLQWQVPFAFALMTVGFMQRLLRQFRPDDSGADRAEVL